MCVVWQTQAAEAAKAKTEEAAARDALTCSVCSASPFMTRSWERRQRQKSMNKPVLVAQKRAWPLIYLSLQYPSTRSLRSVATHTAVGTYSQPGFSYSQLHASLGKRPSSVGHMSGNTTP